MNVKKLIAELDKVDNKFYEVEIELYDKPTIEPSIHSVTIVNGKVIIRPDRKYRNR